MFPVPAISHLKVLGPNFTLGDCRKLNKTYQNLLLDTY